MPIDWQISHPERLVTAEASGIVGLPEIEAYFDAVLVAEAQAYRKLFDASTLQPRVSDDELMLLGGRMRAYDANFPAGPVALVVTTQEAENFMRRFLNLGTVRRPAQIFKTVEAARAWLEQQKG